MVRNIVKFETFCGVFSALNSLLSFRLSVIVYCLDNVHYQHTAQMVKALTEAEVKFRVQVTVNFPIA